VRVVATQAVREATDGASLVDAATEVIGQPLEVLSGDDEARLAYAGATSELDPDLGPFMLLDIGGGSTELAIGDAAMSIPVGSVGISEQHLQSDPPAPEELSNAIALVDAYLDDVLREVPSVAEARMMVGTGGTITTVAAVEIGLVSYDRDEIHQFVLTKEAAEDVYRTLATERLVDRVHNPGLPRDRADNIVGGCCVLVAVMRRLDFKACIVSEADILDGIAAELMG
jgi:exopolyphosphatase/guanosine-5'-triphosphate,3'-diphosphate pyrophosphatase